MARTSTTGNRLDLAGLLLALLLAGLPLSPARAETLTQFSTFDALLQGLYDGPFAVSQIEASGDFGLGAFNGLDGEMVGLEGAFYRIAPDGSAHRVGGTAQAPFAVVTFFHPGKKLPLRAISSFAELTAALDRETGSANLFYAVRIRGTFSRIAARTVVRQRPPYRPLPLAIQEQVLFEWKDIRGTLVGFRCPAYVKGINVPGYHFHFISEDRKRGGHVLDCALAEGDAAIEALDTFRMVLPGDAAFLGANLSAYDEEAGRRVEKTADPIPSSTSK